MHGQPNIKPIEALICDLKYVIKKTVRTSIAHVLNTLSGFGSVNLDDFLSRNTIQREAELL
jgi:hypothetical protein